MRSFTLSQLDFLLSLCPKLAQVFFTFLYRFYIVSDGIPLLIVGVTAAFGMDNYGSRDDAL